MLFKVTLSKRGVIIMNALFFLTAFFVTKLRMVKGRSWVASNQGTSRAFGATWLFMLPKSTSVV